MKNRQSVIPKKIDIHDVRVIDCIRKRKIARSLKLLEERESFGTDYATKSVYDENTSDEGRLIDILGMEQYQELMCRIQQEIDEECQYFDLKSVEETAKEFAEYDAINFDEYLFDDEPIICPECRIAVMAIERTYDAIRCHSCGFGLYLKSSLTSKQLSVADLRQLFGVFFDRHISCCCYNAGIVRNLNPDEKQQICSLVYRQPGLQSNTDSSIRVVSTHCGFEDVYAW